MFSSYYYYVPKLYTEEIAFSSCMGNKISVLVLHNQLIAGLVGRQVKWNSRRGQSQGNPMAPLSYVSTTLDIHNVIGRVVAWPSISFLPKSCHPYPYHPKSTATETWNPFAIPGVLVLLVCLLDTEQSTASKTLFNDSIQSFSAAEVTPNFGQETGLFDK